MYLSCRNLISYLGRAYLTCYVISSKLFSRFSGVLYVGFALGPDIAAIVIRSQPSRSVTPLFFLSALSYLLNAFYTWAIVPESLPTFAEDQCCGASSAPTLHGGGASSAPTLYGGARDSTPGKTHAPVADNVEITPLPHATLLCIRSIRQDFSSIAVLRPRRAGAMRKDYALTFIGIAYFFYLLSLANFQLKYLYAERGEWICITLRSGGTELILQPMDGMPSNWATTFR